MLHHRRKGIALVETEKGILLSKEVVKRWYYVAKERGKTSAMKETRKIWDLLDVLERTFLKY